ncbi:hypothetical protein M5K25_001186 [Dendrobium thyrsiflorum]|uniref:Secreted protein n=1 Tax=Dendrobium thyrsiflorum TaxID=117978 RepID=A0ABD0VPT2_DENTH
MKLINKTRLGLPVICFLFGFVASQQMNNHRGVSYIEEPEGVVEAEASQKVTRHRITEGGVSHTTAKV